ncbi:hypothetical protein QBC35DRAFT_499472 [Podospora australis]|uniref:Uncharacterized protein n=1 Tax=Podospora australis TaxID=1536484 RepID=A0AAN7AH91_9PEZI|nr:hypothetical protein QBC35DRAFT_499472 [Podospora australis]
MVSDMYPLYVLLGSGNLWTLCSACSAVGIRRMGVERAGSLQVHAVSHKIQDIALQNDLVYGRGHLSFQNLWGKGMGKLNDETRDGRENPILP